jgi:phosphatidylglycerophosphatase C
VSLADEDVERSQQTATVAAFDFDGTVVRGGSVMPFLMYARGAGRVLQALLRSSPSLLKAAIAGGSTADVTKERLFVQVLAGLPAEALNSKGRSFARRHLERRLRPEVADRIAWHRGLGHRIVLVSASPEAYVGPAGELLGVDGVMATRLAVDGAGRLTGRYDGRNCRGHEKYSRLVSWMRAEGIDTAEVTVWAYGNSRGDLRLLDAADHGVDAGKLGKLGRLARFPRLSDLPPAVHKGARL